MPLLTILAASAGLAQEQPTFRAGVALVKVDTQVTDRAGRIIPGLGAADFQVLDEGQAQPIAHFGRESEPLDVVLLLDVSGSMTRWLEEMAASARAALAPLGSADRVGVMDFSLKSAVRQELTGDFALVGQKIRDAVRDRGLGSGTAMNAALIDAAHYLHKQPARGRRAILIVTDNNDLNYQVPDENVIRELYGADAVLDVILVGKQKQPAPVKGSYTNPDFTPDDALQLADATGGEMVEARKGGTFREMIERIRARYSLQYQEPAGSAPGGFRKIQVELSPAARGRYPGAVISARRGYYAE